MDLVFPPSPCLAADIMISDACFSDLWVIPGYGAGLQKQKHGCKVHPSIGTADTPRETCRWFRLGDVFLTKVLFFTLIISISFYIRNISPIGDSEEALKG